MRILVVLTLLTLASAFGFAKKKKEQKKQKLGCCYQVGWGVRMKASYSNFVDRLEKDCEVETRMGGATKYSDKACSKLKASLLVSSKKSESKKKSKLSKKSAASKKSSKKKSGEASKSKKSKSDEGSKKSKKSASKKSSKKKSDEVAKKKKGWFWSWDKKSKKSKKSASKKSSKKSGEGSKKKKSKSKKSGSKKSKESEDDDEEETASKKSSSKKSASKSKKSKSDCVCTKEYKPVCGTNGKTYSNSCGAKCADVKLRCGKCGCKTCEKESGWFWKVTYACKEKKPCVCTKEYKPVCAANKKTYSNACLAKCAGQKLRCDDCGCDSCESKGWWRYGCKKEKAKKGSKKAAMHSLVGSEHELLDDWLSLVNDNE